MKYSHNQLKAVIDFVKVTASVETTEKNNSIVTMRIDGKNYFEEHPLLDEAINALSKRLLESDNLHDKILELLNDRINAGKGDIEMIAGGGLGTAVFHIRKAMDNYGSVKSIEHINKAIAYLNNEIVTIERNSHGK